MAWIKFISIFCSIMIVQSRIKFKMKSCDHMRDVTILFDPFIDVSTPAPVHHYDLYFPMLDVPKIYMLIRKEACLKNVSLVSFQPHAVINKLESPGAFLDIKFSHENELHNTHVKEFLQLYEIQEEEEKVRTLVFISKRTVRQDILDILYRLQTERKVVVIFVSMFDIGSYQFPRHLKLLISHNPPKQLVDVITNPSFNLLKFNKYLPTSKDRSCLKNVKFILVAEKMRNIQVVAMLNKLRYVNSLSNYSPEILNVQVLADSQDRGDFQMKSVLLSIHRVDFKNLSFAQLNKTGIFKGNERKIFLFLDISGQQVNDPDIVHMKNLLKDNDKIVVELFIKKLKFRFGGGNSYDKNHWYDYDSEEGVFKALDHLVDAGCK